MYVGETTILHSHVVFYFLILTILCTHICSMRRCCDNEKYWPLASRWLPTATAWLPSSGHVGFVVDKAAVEQVFSEYFGFPCH
jgi:hypothetical protein